MAEFDAFLDEQLVLSAEERQARLENVADSVGGLVISDLAS